MREITVVMIGDTGAGKSSFGNYYLGTNAFEANDSEAAVTTEAVAKSNIVDGCVRWVIDTEGLNDGQSINAVQIQKLAQLMRNYQRGVNAIAIVLNGQHDRFSQGVKDIIKFAYSAFATKEALNYFCIVFTKCYTRTNPKRDTKQTRYMTAVKNYLSEISGTPIDEVPEIPVYFVDCYPEGENTDSETNKNLFHGWAMLHDPLDTSKFKEASYREDRIEETRTKHSTGFETIGDTTYELFEDQKRTKIVPNNRDPPRYSEWICTKKYKEAIKKEITERKNNVDLGYRYSNDGLIRYKATVDQEKKTVRDLRRNKDISNTGWYNISEERLTEAGRIVTVIEKRNRKFETKNVVHHSGHGFFGGNDHTHVTLVHRVYQEQRTNTTDFDGRTTSSDWLIVPGSERSYHVGNWEEGGWTGGYTKEIAA